MVASCAAAETALLATRLARPVPNHGVLPRDREAVARRRVEGIVPVVPARVAVDGLGLEDHLGVVAGGLVAVGRKNWKSKPTVGVVMGMQYLAYEPKFCKWRVMVGDEVRVIHQSNLFLLEETG